MQTERYYNRIEQKRKAALASQDPLNYHRFCTEAGLQEGDIEDFLLFSLGSLESITLKRKTPSTHQRTVVQNTEATNAYQELLKNHERKEVSEQLDRDATLKLELLQKYFPRFAANGKQSLRGYDDAQVGAVYAGVIKYARTL